MLAMTDTQHTDREPRFYELAFLIVPTISEEHLPKELDAIRALVAETGTIAKEGETKPLNLAYEMRTTLGNKIHRFKSAYFGFMYFEAMPDRVLALKETLKKNDNILRTLIVKQEKEILATKAPKKPRSGEVDKKEVGA